MSLQRPRRSWFHYAIVFSFYFGTLGCHPVAPDPQKSVSIPPGSTLRVATSGDYSPFSRWGLNEAEPSGFSVAIARAYADDRGTELDWIRFRWSELAADLEADAFDIALSGITVRPDRSMKGRFSLPLTTSGAVALVHEESRFEESADFEQSTIRLAVNAGGHLERVARRLFPAATILAVEDNANVLEELIQNRVDVVLTDSLEAPHWQRIAKRRLRAIGPLTRDRKAAWFPQGNTAEAERFNRWLLRAESSGQLERIRDQYELPRGRTANALPALLASLDERLTLMPAVADAKHVLGVATENSQREELVLDAASLGVLRAAEDAEVEAPDSELIRRLFRSQIEAAKWIQDRRRDGLRAAASESQTVTEDAARAELEEVIRPALIYLGDRISMLLIACAESPTPSFALTDVSDALERHDLPKDHVRRIYEALAAIIQPESRSATGRSGRSARRAAQLSIQ